MQLTPTAPHTHKHTHWMLTAAVCKLWPSNPVLLLSASLTPSWLYNLSRCLMINWMQTACNLLPAKTEGNPKLRCNQLSSLRTPHTLTARFSHICYQGSVSICGTVGGSDILHNVQVTCFLPKSSLTLGNAVLRCCQLSSPPLTQITPWQDFHRLPIFCPDLRSPVIT